jgi:hypothetical protein
MSTRGKIIGAVLIFVVVAWASYILAARKLNDEDTACAQVLTSARNPETEEVVEFPTPCDVPEGWEVVEVNGVVISGLLAGENAVYVQDQAPGDRVFVSSVVFAASGWVVIHEGQNGVPGNILGAARFDTGGHTGEVELLRGTVDGGVYYAMLHTDNGDRTFDLKNDTPIRDDTGDPVMMRFAAREGAPDPRNSQIQI